MKKTCTTLLSVTRKPARLWFGFIIVLYSLLPAQLQAQSGYVKKYRALADSLSGAYGIPAAVILGVALVESGAGNTKTAKLLNNHFGIVGINKLKTSHKIKTRYKQYPSVTASYIAFCNLLSRRKFYQKLKGQPDYKKWVDAISKTGYSEKPEEWKKKITTAIRKNKLAK